MNAKSDSYTLTCRSAALPYPKHGRRRPCGALVYRYIYVYTIMFSLFSLLMLWLRVVCRVVLCVACFAEVFSCVPRR